MSSFKRIFKYIWPQWPRVVVVVISAVLVAALMSLTIMTAIPAIKVLMSDEGLHGWAYRKVCSYRYGMKFEVPKKTDYETSDIAFYLLVTDVEDNSLAQKAGIQKLDQIIGVDSFWITDEVKRIPASKLLETLAIVSGESEVKIQLRRLISEVQVKEVAFNSGPHPFYLDHLEKAMKLVPRDNKEKATVYIVLLLVIVTIVKCLAKFYQTYLAQKIVLTGVNRLREDLYGHVLDMPMSFFSDNRPSDAVSRLINDTNVMGKAIKIMLGKALREPLCAIFYVASAAILNWKLTLIFLLVGPFVFGIVGLFGRKMKKASKRSLVATSQMLAKLQETMIGLKVVKVYNQQNHEKKLFKLLNSKLLKQLLKISKIDSATTPVLEVLGMLAISAALLIGVHWVVEAQLDSTEFFVLVALLGIAAESVRKTSDIWNKIQEANAASERVFSVMDEALEFEQVSACELEPLKEKIEFRDVVFTYPGSIEPVLKGVNLTVEAGHNVAVVGPNGSGKTTLINLLPRFYDVDSGSILIDGHDIHESTLKSLRERIGMVTQNVVTFNDTIAANIAYGKTDASKEQIIEAAKRSYADEFISPLPDGYDTIIGESGVGLSGGQLQRVIIARAILKNPEILIFDEATSQVDADSEAKIHKAIEEIMRDRTSFIIAHRFSTVITADVIVVMDNGRIIAQGQHDELIKECKLYQSLYETQLISA